VIDFDAMWGSDKLASCADWAQAEYAWLYGLADASGCFEMTNLRVIWGRVAAVRGNFTIERLEQVFAEFQDKGLLFVWAHEGKRYAHWTGSDVPGRLPPPSWRMRLEKFAPPVPKLLLVEYMARFARGRAALAGGGFRGESAGSAEAREDNLKFEISNLKYARSGEAEDAQIEFQGCAAGNEDREKESIPGRVRGENCREGGEENDLLKIGLKGGVEGDQGQDWDLNLSLDLKRNGNKELERGAAGAGGGRIGKFPGESENQGKSENEDQNKNQKKDQDRKQDQDQDKNEIKSAAFYNSNAKATANSNALTGLRASPDRNLNAKINSRRPCEVNSNSISNEHANFNSNANSSLNALGNELGSAVAYRMNAREIAVQRELRVGAGPVCGPVRIRPEVLERIRLREEARARAGTRAPRGIWRGRWERILLCSEWQGERFAFGKNCWELRKVPGVEIAGFGFGISDLKFKF
jgi:hypothetical protein